MTIYLIAGIAAVWAGYVLYDLMPVRRSVFVNRVNRLLSDESEEEESLPLSQGLAVMFGRTFGRFAPVRWVIGVERKLYWAQRGGKWKGWSPQDVWGASFLGALVMFAMLLFVGRGHKLGMVIIGTAMGFYYPMIRLTSDYNAVLRKVRQELPGMAQNMALVVNAGASLEEALRRASARNTPLGAWMRDVLSRSAGQNLFSDIRSNTTGFLLREAQKSRDDDLVFLATQLDLIHQHGTRTWELLDDLAGRITRMRRAEMMKRAEALENKLVIPVMVFFFAPYVLLVLYPAFAGAMGMFR